jgi:hypothetical protein
MLAPLFGFALAATNGPAVTLQIDANGEAECFAMVQPAAPKLAFAPGQWHKVTLIAERSGGTYTTECRVDAQPAVRVSGIVDGRVTQDRKLALGLGAVGGGRAEAVYDNVVFRAQ